ncbi:MAG: GMC family oxidoreductase [Candidatus Handelsmanbacteria bacterium]|nr:GMC family oxidoreductase [Candidatus Handelsmanbacteria bacterium]
MNAPSYDAVVIGSGFGGAGAAHVLTGAGLRTLLLERGGWPRRDDQDWDQQAILIDKRYQSDSPLLVRQYGSSTFVPLHLNETVGGMSVFYGGASLRLREGDFARWPIKYSDLEPYYTRAEQLLGVHGQAGADPFEPPRSAAYPLAPVALTPPAQRIQQAARSLGYRPFPIPLALNFSDPARPRCILCNTCDGFPCKLKAKNDLTATLLQEAQVQGLEIRAGAIVTRLVRQGVRITGVEGVDKFTKQPFSFLARLFVLAGGAIHSPALLLRSGLGGPTVGRFLMRHCNGVVAGIFPFATNPAQIFHKQLCLADFYEDHRAAHGTATGIIQDIYTPASPVIRHFAPTGFKRIAGMVAGHIQNLLCIAEDEPLPENQVSLSAQRDVFGMELVQVQHRYTEADCARRDYLTAKARHVLRRAGAFLFKTYRLDSFSHAVGSVRFGTSPAESALDPNCRLWETENLFVTDSSFMPSSGGVNPSLTIAANALRVGEYLTQTYENI